MQMLFELVCTVRDRALLNKTPQGSFCSVTHTILPLAITTLVQPVAFWIVYAIVSSNSNMWLYNIILLHSTVAVGKV
jgi:hypothetical protein